MELESDGEVLEKKKQKLEQTEKLLEAKRASVAKAEEAVQRAVPSAAVPAPGRPGQVEGKPPKENETPQRGAIGRAVRPLVHANIRKQKHENWQACTGLRSFA